MIHRVKVDLHTEEMAVVETVLDCGDDVHSSPGRRETLHKARAKIKKAFLEAVQRKESQ